MKDVFYRPEIDGLRAVAILAVLLFHADFKAFSGGFVGVDVFFVISGYLIGHLLLQNLKDGTFDFWNFWQRRICRILPALSVMVGTVLIIGSVIYFPEDYKLVARQAAFQSVMAPNIYFYSLSGYFNPDHATKPLLHTWSLGVEEQFYILIPFVLYFARKKMRKRFIPVLAGITILSFAASVYAVLRSPDAAFYLLPFRMWELMAGTMVAALSIPAHIRKWQAEALAASGLLMIVIGVLLYTSKTLFPGFSALLPCLGAALFIWSNGSHLTKAGRLLSFKPFVFIGVISYSLYLWHWPIFAMIDYIPIIPEHWAVKPLMIVASFILAILSWRYIETPFNRMARTASRKQAYVAMAICLFFFAASGVSAFVYAKLQPTQTGFLNVAAAHKDINPNREKCQHKDGSRFERDDVCETNPGKHKKPGFIMLGDSHGDADAPIFYRLSERSGRNGYVAFKHGCPPILGFSMPGWKESENQKCHEFVKTAFDFIDRKKIKTVFLIGYWDNWLKDEGDAFFEPGLQSAGYKNIGIAGLQHALDELKQKNVKIYVLLSTPPMKAPVPRLLGFQERFGLGHASAYISRDDYLKNRPAEMQALIKQNPNVTFLDPAQLFCPKDKCWAFEGNNSLYYDKNHLSSYGVEKLRALFAPVFYNDAFNRFSVSSASRKRP